MNVSEDTNSSLSSSLFTLYYLLFSYRIIFLFCNVSFSCTTIPSNTSLTIDLHFRVSRNGSRSGISSRTNNRLFSFVREKRSFPPWPQGGEVGGFSQPESPSCPPSNLEILRPEPFQESARTIVLDSCVHYVYSPLHLPPSTTLHQPPVLLLLPTVHISHSCLSSDDLSTFSSLLVVCTSSYSFAVMSWGLRRLKIIINMCFKKPKIKMTIIKVSREKV